MSALASKVKETIKRYRMTSLSQNGKNRGLQTWIIALSGGPDSMALWRVLVNLTSELGLKLVVAHVNHCLRGKESDQDADWVQAQVAETGLPYHAKVVDTEKIAREKKLGIEETARDLRYTFFAELAQSLKADAVATGRNLDDQAETVFMRVVRGAGMDGLGGIPPVNQKRDLRIIRPLIETTRTEILDFLQEENCEFRQDRSNSDPKYRRNFVRHELLPRIEKEWNPAVKKILARSAQQHREVYQFIEDETKRWWNRAVRLNGKSAKLKGGILKKASPFMQQEVVKRVLRRLAPDSSERFNFEHFVETARLLSAKKNGGGRLSLPDGIEAQMKGKDLVISVGTERNLC